MMKINVLHISTAISWRGGEQQLVYLKDILNSQYNVSSKILCVKNSELEQKLSNSEKITLHKPSSVSLQWIKSIHKICAENNIHIIHVHDSKSQTLAILSAIFYKIPPIIVSRKVLFPIKGMLSKLKYQNKHIKKVICISSAVKKEMQKILPNHKIAVIQDCIDVAKFKKEKLKHFPFLSSTKTKIGYVAALTEEKDHITFIKTAQEIIKVKNDVEFYIVGSGILEKELKNKVKKLNLEKEVIFTGFVNEINDLILQLDMLLFTSKLEGLGTTVLDFFAAKKPVVATNSRGVKDVLIHNKTGVLCKTEDVENLAKAVIELIDDENKTMTLVNNAFTLVVEKHSIKTLGEQHFKLYKNIVTNK